MPPLALTAQGVIVQCHPHSESSAESEHTSLEIKGSLGLRQSRGGGTEARMEAGLWGRQGKGS